MLDLRFYFSVFLRRLPYFLILLFIGVGAGTFVAMILPPVYEAEARLVVEREQIPDDLAETTVQTDAKEQLQILQQRILTRETLLDMARSQGIYEGRNAPETPMTPDQMVRDLRQRVSIVSRGGTVRRGQTDATIVTVSFEGPSAQMVANVTNEIVTLLVSENVEMRTSVSGETLAFFNQQVDQLETQLSQASAEILRFKEANQDALPDNLDYLRNSQAAEQERLLELQRQETLLRDRRDQLVTIFQATGETGVAEPELPQTVEAQQLKELKDRLAISVASLSLDNPRLKVLRAQIAALEEVVAEQQAAQAIAQGGEVGATPLSPYELQIADLDGQLDFIAEQKAQINERMAEYQTFIAATPANALTLERLDRNFANLRTQYDQAVRKRAAAETGDTIEALAKGQRMTVLENATPPSEPSSPDRPKIAALGVGGGLAMGIGLIVLLELLNTSIRRAEDLRRGLEIEPLVTLPYMRTKGQVWRRRMIIGAGLAVVLVGLPGALWYVDQNVRPLQPYLDPLLAQLGLA